MRPKLFRRSLLTVAALAVAFLSFAPRESHACCGRFKSRCVSRSVSRGFVRGQPLRNVAKWVTGSARRSRRS